MITKVLNLVIKTDEAQKGLQQTNQEIVDIEGNLDGVTAIGDKFTGGLVSGFTGALKSIKAVNMGFKSMRLAIISTGIGALVVVIGSLIAAFKSSEEGQNKFNKLTTVMGALVGNLVDLLADFGEKIIAAFENPQKAIKDFAKLIRDNIVNRFEGLLELIPALGKAVKLLFEGEFKEAGKVAINANAKIVLGVENITDKTEKAISVTKDFIKEQENELKLAAEVADMRAKADKIDRQLLIDRSKLESEIALLRLKARQEDEFSAEVRKNALLEAQELEDQLLNQEKEALILRRDAQVLENTFSRTNKENLDKEAQAVAEVNRLVARRADIARQLQRELNTINNQIEAANKKAKNDQEIELERIQIRKAAIIDSENEIIENKQKSSTILGQLAQKDAAEKKRLDDEELARQQALQDALFQGALNTLTTISNLNQLFAGKTEAEQKKAFENQKAISIAETLISTSQSAVKSYTSLAGIPIVGPVLGFAASAAAITAGMLQVKNIRAQEFNSQRQPSPATTSGGIGGGTSGTTAASQPANFNVVGQSGFNQISQAIQQQGPVQAFVVGSEVTTQQQLDNAIVSTATLGN